MVKGPYYRRPDDSTELPEVDVAIVMESTYPFLKGGVSGVVHDIVTRNPDLVFGIIHIAWDSNDPSEDLYGVPENVAWVDVVYLSLGEDARPFQQASLPEPGVDYAAMTRRLRVAFYTLSANNPAPFWSLYDDTINPATRHARLWPVLTTSEFMEACVAAVPQSSSLTLAELFWNLRDFFSLAFALTDRVHPRAKVYHAHTTGYASLIAACAARQNDSAFLLTEHNLYLRDTINTLLGRDMNLPVTRYSYRDLPDNPVDRMWVRWWCDLGAALYPSADHITYLYPAAVKEAIELGADESRTEVLPNGLNWDDFAYGRARRKRPIKSIAAGEHSPWRFACIARVVPIKGIIQMIDIAAEAVSRGYRDFEIDVLGPTEHVPEYYQECLRHVEETGMQGVVTFRGTVVVRECLHDYDALVLSSFNEGQPLVVLEAMACGLPVIGTRVGGMDHTVTLPVTAADGTIIGPCGDLVEPGDVTGFADRLCHLMDDPALYLEWHGNALERLRAEFMIDMIMSRYNTIYRELGAGDVQWVPISSQPADLGEGPDDVSSEVRLPYQPGTLRKTVADGYLGPSQAG
ncbi:GT4 family glycosyltransferase PelF [Acidipropionibacterium virtanenii]|uniref:N-acetyl-alpha-D-glucosaminyl L-malate synthase n=1 Tax=Acidipropionibacterium virtanenii TaxID=2057246 RepID=A0A344USU1_9ACTN|nr:GT4 family glycosyltransferase PelF [Acidipropionibacterium virtanenii]AXE38339.1 N-acetyl-alpha-D-glucosaminyl L-malate synthase [Acidipropionibacterium virtanenii]